MLEIKNLSKSYVPGKKAVNDLSLTIEAGEIFAFIGHNGAGKTTAIKSIVGILDFDSGQILLNNIDVKKNPIAFKQMIAYIPDNPEIYENLTGLQFLKFVGNIYKIPANKQKEDIVKYAKIFDIYDQLGDLISSYSRGMKQKLSLISAFIRNPQLLILDEPFVGLDPFAASKMKELMKEMASKGSIIMFSTHVLEVAEKFCDHVAIIKKGKLIKYGTMAEVKGDKSLESIFMETVDNE
ncbi:MAG: ABC transporter ATP-binding protein [Acholeplasma sp.]|nr:ABC transporter ATP-binding protein [Acholeplasma sp.]